MACEEYGKDYRWSHFESLFRDFSSPKEVSKGMDRKEAAFCLRGGFVPILRA